MKIFNYSITILNFLLLIQTINNFYNIRSWINNNRFKIIPKFKRGRVLALWKDILKNHTSSNLTSVKTLDDWFKYNEEELFNKVGVLHHNGTCSTNDTFFDWFHNKTKEIKTVFNANPDSNDKNIININLKVWEKLEEYIQYYINYLKDAFSCDIRKFNVTDISNWLYNQSRCITYNMNQENDPTKKKIFNNTHDIWSRMSKYLDEHIPKSINETLLTFNTTNANSSTSFYTPTSSPSLEYATLSTTNLLPEIESEGVSSAVCTGILCGSTIAYVSIPVVIAGVLIGLAIIYKTTSIGSLLRRDNIRKQQRRKRSHERLMETAVESQELLSESEKRSSKRSRLDSFLRAFGFIYRSIFPYIDEGKHVNERSTH